MLKPTCQYSWTYARHIHRQHISRRYLAVAAAATIRSALHPPKADPPSPLSSHDDPTLRKIFDSQPFWHEFSWSSVTGPQRGLFQNRHLKDPLGFHDFTQVALAKCRGIVAKVLQASTMEDYKAIPRDLDRLSDSLCRVLDIAEFVRVTHPDDRFQKAANEAYAMLFEYMNILNTMTGLNEKLQKAMATPEISVAWSEEEKTVATVLLRDFSKSAIDMPQDKREKFVALSTHISQLGTTFVSNMAPATYVLRFNSSRLKGMDPVILREITHRFGTVRLPTTGPLSITALRTVEEEDARRQIYIAGRTASKNQLHILETLLVCRGEVARLSGYESYADMNLSDKMAKSPEAVKSFLTALAADNASHVKEELEEMLRIKKSGLSSRDSPLQLNAWDRDYYQARLAAQLRSKSRKPDFISAYFSLGTVMQGLSRLFTRLYGVRFVPREASAGETWNPDVRRLDVIDESEGHIAVLYCDLFARAGKSRNPAHFTLRCSRQISLSEVSEAASASPDQSPQLAANDGMAISQSPTTGAIHQLPIIALICNFQSNQSSPSQPTLLSFRDLQTLFHEMGHAIHSILGRTSLHVVSGTRCATDFAELPSVLMEHFAADPDVLSLFARHWETDAPLPYEMVAERLAIDRKGQGAETETQILLAMLDQAYHSSLPLSMGGGFDTTRVFHDVYDNYGSIPEPRETSAQGFFGHLVEYGGTYYSYLFDRAIAGKVWKEVFRGGQNGGAVSRDAGERFRKEVLSWGGGRDGWRCVAGLLGDEKLKDGGKEAMEEVGRWGVKD